MANNIYIPTVKSERPPGWLKLPDGSIWSIGVAVTRGLAIRDSEKPEHLFVGFGPQQSMPVDALIAAGMIDREGADHVLALPQAKQPQVPVSVTSHRVERTWRPTLDPSSLELAFVAAMRTWIESDMGPESDEKLALAFRRAVRSAAGMSSR